MSESKEKCSLDSPCDKNICNLDTNKCRVKKKGALSFYIKDKLYTGSKKQVINSIRQKYSKIVKNAKCDLGEHIETHQKYTGQNYKQLEKVLGQGKLIAFYSPSTNKIVCVTRYELVEYWRKIHNDYYGIAITKDDIENLRKSGFPYYQRLINNKRGEYFVPLGSQLSFIFIKESQINTILTKGYSFFTIVKSDLYWMNTLGPESKYNNYNPSTNKFGDNLYILVPLSDTENKEEKEINDFKQSIVAKYCNSTDSIIPNRQVQHLSRKLYLSLSQLDSNRLSEIEKSVINSLAADLAKVKPSKKVNYPYWYSLSGPMGRKLIKTLNKYNISLKNKKELSYPNITFEYQEKYITEQKKVLSRYTVSPVYINTQLNQYLVCQKHDVNYEVNLYMVKVDSSLYFTQHFSKAVKQYDKIPNNLQKMMVKLPLNSRYPQPIPINMVLTKNSPVYSVKIYGVVILFKNGINNLYMCGTSLKAMTREYESLYGTSESKEGGKLLVELEMDTVLTNNIFTRNILKEEYYESPMSNRLSYLKNFAEAFRKRDLANMTEKNREKFNRYIYKVLEEQRRKDLSPETKEEMKQKIRNIVGYFITTNKNMLVNNK